jgi:hypothetical protein
MPINRWYPQNAYHTYWALVVLESLPHRLSAEKLKEVVPNSECLIQGMRLWARAKLAEEIALHSTDSATLVSDQLTWGLTAFIKNTENLSSDLRAQDLIRTAFAALARTQQPNGSWRHYAPLFVYSHKGNAYCYVYESFTYLLKAVLDKFEAQEFFEGVMEAFIVPLQRLRQYAEITQVQHPSSDKTDAIGWTSGHRPGESNPEGWATASVFSFLQAYRRLVGLLARRAALRELHMSSIKRIERPLNELGSRGDTWLEEGKESSTAEQLLSLFVYPILTGQSNNPSEPDDQPIEEFQARSAILFGPPGTSKTTLARCVAEALGWKYIELHSSHFVAEGIGAIQRTADKVFALLMELDHAVVLFDEPDELVREREGSPDAFGRFLTTSMLPKLAELWKQSRVIYFIATNHINYFDAAIIRSERFDVVVSVPPPSFRSKLRELTERLEGMVAGKVTIQVEQKEIDAKLGEISNRVREARASANKDHAWPGDHVLDTQLELAKFVLIRWDQLEELAWRLAPRADTDGSLSINAEVLADALGKVADPRLSKIQSYADFLDGLQYARRDFQRRPVFSLRECPQELTGEKGIIKVGEKHYFKCASGDLPSMFKGRKVVRTGIPGEITL